jgi:hypothetical protein
MNEYSVRVSVCTGMGVENPILQGPGRAQAGSKPGKAAIDRGLLGG